MVSVQLDKIRSFRYGMKALSRIEGLLGVPVSKLDFDNLTQLHLATIICCGFMHEDPDLTPDKVMDLIDEHSSLVEITAAMGQAFTEAFGTKTGKGEKGK
jgi:hypothetical protein